MDIVAVRKHNSTFVEFITNIAGESVLALNGRAELIRFPTAANNLKFIKRFPICAANATCSAFSVSGIDTAAALDQARAELERNGFEEGARRLQYNIYATCLNNNDWTFFSCSGGCGIPQTKIEKIEGQYYSSYSGTRHVVFFAHGLTGTVTSMWNKFCRGPTGCPAIELVEFQHLVFAFLESKIFDFFTRCWGAPWGSFANTGVEYTPATSTTGPYHTTCREFRPWIRPRDGFPA